MHNCNIIDARLSRNGFEPKGIGRAAIGKKEFANPNGILLEKAYGRIGEISGMDEKVLVPPCIIIDLEEAKTDRLRVLSFLRAVVEENTKLVYSRIYPQRMDACENAIFERTRASMQMLEAIYAKSMNEGYFYHPAIRIMFLVMPGNGKDDAKGFLDLAIDGYYNSIATLVNGRVRTMRLPQEEAMLLMRVLAIMESRPDLSDLLGDYGKGEAAGWLPEGILSMEIKRMLLLRQFFDRNKEDGLLAVLNMLDTLPHIGVEIDEFMGMRTLEKSIASGEPIIPTRKLGAVLADFDVLKDGRLTENGKGRIFEEVSAAYGITN